MWSLCPCVSRNTSAGPGSFSSSGTTGLPVTQGSISTRLPPGVSMSQVACPNHVSSSPFPSAIVVTPLALVPAADYRGSRIRRHLREVNGHDHHISTTHRDSSAALLAVAAGLIAPNTLIAFYLTALAAALLLIAAFLAYLACRGTAGRAQRAGGRNGRPWRGAGDDRRRHPLPGRARPAGAGRGERAGGGRAARGASPGCSASWCGCRLMMRPRCASGCAPCGICCTGSRDVKDRAEAGPFGTAQTQTGVPIGVLL